MKAWIAREKDSFMATVVFAETRGKARAIAQYTDACEDCVCTTKIITAKDYDEAKSIAWEIFPEYESVYVSEVE